MQVGRGVARALLVSPGAEREGNENMSLFPKERRVIVSLIFCPSLM
jgi:hypothetical protein